MFESAGRLAADLPRISTPTRTAASTLFSEVVYYASGVSVADAAAATCADGVVAIPGIHVDLERFRYEGGTRRR